jgi:hypothetical protein
VALDGLNNGLVMHGLAQTKSSQIKTARLLHRRDGSGGAVAPLGMVHSH